MTRAFAMGRRDRQPCSEHVQPSRAPLFSSCARVGLSIKVEICGVGRNYLLCEAIVQEGLDWQLEGKRGSE